MGKDTETINLKALLAENQAETAHIKDTLVAMELERDRLRSDVLSRDAKIDQMGTQLAQMSARVVEAEEAVRTTMKACDDAVFGLAALVDKANAAAIEMERKLEAFKATVAHESRAALKEI
jgi:uncharacterized protein YPO0396